MMDNRDRKMGRVSWWAASLCVLALCGRAGAWDEDGHVIVTRLAYVKLPKEMPDWLRDPKVRERLEYLSSEPDRWRGQHSEQVDHANNLNHYVDEEDLHDYGLSLKTLPLFRREYLDVLATARAKDPSKLERYNRSRDTSYTSLTPGLLPYEIAELQWKLAASWTTLKTYEQYRSYVTDSMIENARENVIYEMGILSHFVGDGSQPLHLTRHHHGWVGANPKGYTTSRGIHAYIDGGVIAKHDLTPASLASRAAAPRKVSEKEYFRSICDYLMETFEQVEPLYALEKSGKLDRAEGKAFIEARLIAGGSMLSGVWEAAYNAAVIDEFRVNKLTGGAPKEN